MNAPPTLITRDRQALDLTLLGDPSKAKAKLGWMPIMTTQEMCAKMCEEDLKEAKKEALLRKHEFNKAIPSEWSKSALSPEFTGIPSPESRSKLSPELDGLPVEPGNACGVHGSLLFFLIGLGLSAGLSLKQRLHFLLVQPRLR